MAPILHYGADGVVVNILRCERREGRFKSGSAPHMSLEPVGEAAVCKTAEAGSVPVGDSSDRAAPAAYKRRRSGEGRVTVRSARQAERLRADPAQPTKVGPAGEHGTCGGERPRAGAARSSVMERQAEW
jgi:hypothetical protein